MCEGGKDLLLAGVNDTGGDKYGAWLHKLPDILAEADDDIRHDVGHDDIKLALYLLCQISLQNCKAGGGKAVYPPILHRSFDRERIDIHTGCAFGAQQKGAQGEDAAAAADIEQLGFRRDIGFQCFEAQARGVMPACAKGKPRLQVENLAASRVIFLLPQRADQQLFANGQGLKILFPVIFPILRPANPRCNLVADARGMVPLA